MLALDFAAVGVPRPMPRHRWTSGGRARRDPTADAWQRDVRAAARAALAESPDPAAALAAVTGEPPVVDAVSVRLAFRLPRPPSHHRRDGSRSPSWRPWPTVGGRDVDNLAKAVLDALGPWHDEPGVVWADDACVVALAVSKRYATPAAPAGVVVRLRSVDALRGP